MKLQLALHLLLLTIFQLYLLNLFSLLQSVSLLACSLDASPWMPAVILYYWTLQGTVLSKTLFLFFVLAFMCYLWEKYCKPTIVQCYIANCVSWVPRLTLLDL